MSSQRPVTAEDRQRFETLYRRAFRPVSAYALRRSGPTDAADVVAETFAVAWRRVRDVPDGPDDIPWLLGVARNVLANQRRSNRRRNAVTAALAHALEPARPPHEPGGGALAAALARLPEDQQELLRLVAWDGLRPRELAVLFGCTPNAAAIRLHRARRALADALERTERIDADRTLQGGRGIGD